MRSRGHELLPTRHPSRRLRRLALCGADLVALLLVPTARCFVLGVSNTPDAGILPTRHDVVTSIPVIWTGSCGRSWAPVAAAAMASTTSIPAVTSPKMEYWFGRP